MSRSIMAEVYDQPHTLFSLLCLMAVAGKIMTLHFSAYFRHYAHPLFL